MNREFNILNTKLNVLFEELMWLKKDFQRATFEREKKELEYKVKNAQDELNCFKDNQRFIFERLDEARDRFHRIEYEFPKEELDGVRCCE